MQQGVYTTYIHLRHATRRVDHLDPSYTCHRENVKLGPTLDIPQGGCTTETHFKHATKRVFHLDRS